MEWPIYELIQLAICKTLLMICYYRLEFKYLQQLYTNNIILGQVLTITLHYIGSNVIELDRNIICSCTIFIRLMFSIKWNCSMSTGCSLSRTYWALFFSTTWLNGSMPASIKQSLMGLLAQMFVKYLLGGWIICWHIIYICLWDTSGHLLDFIRNQ